MDLSHSLRKRCSIIRDLALGLPEHRFWNLFIQCSLCKIVVLREPFSSFHECSSRQQTQLSLSGLSVAFDGDGSSEVGSADDGLESGGSEDALSK